MDNTVIELARKFKNKIQHLLPFKMLILYGSYAKGTANENSDIDLAVIVDNIEENYIETSAKMYKYVWEIDSRLEPVILSLENDKSGFVESILKYGIII